MNKEHVYKIKYDGFKPIIILAPTIGEAVEKAKQKLNNEGYKVLNNLKVEFIA